MVTRSIWGFAGIVPGPPKGIRGSTERVHLPRRALWAEYGGEPAPGGLVRPQGPKAPRVENPTGWGRLPPNLGGKSPPWPPRPSRCI